jgi:hypothetical protein
LRSAVLIDAKQPKVLSSQIAINAGGLADFDIEVLGRIASENGYPI